MAPLDSAPRANDPDPFAAARADIDQRLGAFLEGADVWAQRSELNEDTAWRANDFIAGAKKLLKDAEDARKAEKKPHMDAAKEVDRTWDAIKTRIEKVIGVVTPLLAAHLRKKEEERRAREEEARRKAREAEEAARLAAADAAAAQSAQARIEAEARAEAEAQRAKEAEAEAARAREPVRVESSTGLTQRKGLRTIRTPVIVSLPQALSHYRAEPELQALILKLAARDLREAPTRRGEKQIPTIPGISWNEEKAL
jgi:hypothetical protein